MCVMTQGCPPMEPGSAGLARRKSQRAVPFSAQQDYVRTMVDRMKSALAKFGIGQVVKHRKYPFRGVVYDVDPVFANTEEWWLAIPEDMRPRKDQPFYHLYAENTETEYIAYVSEQNLLPDTSGEPLRHAQIDEMFVRTASGAYEAKAIPRN